MGRASNRKKANRRRPGHRQPMWEYPWNRYADGSVLQEAELRQA
jgi:hypothetical protein